MKQFWRYADGFVTFLSPIAALFYILSAVLLIGEWNEHPNHIQALTGDDKLITGQITYLYDDGDAQVEFVTPAGQSHFAILEKEDHPEDSLQTLALNSTQQIRYDPTFQFSPVLADHWDYFQAQNPRREGLFTMLGLCLVILAIRPDILYIGYQIDWPQLYRRELPPPDPS